MTTTPPVIDQDADLRAYDAEDLDITPTKKSVEPETVVHDIETAALPFDQIKHLMPVFTAPANYKDAAKIAENIEEQKVKWIEKAALSPVTGRVCAIGYLTGGQTLAYLDPDGYGEADLLSQFWSHIGPGTTLIGFNTHGFDLPFLMRRSWKHGIKVPHWLMRGRYFNSSIDLMEMWNCGSRDFVSLNTVAKFFDCGAKTGSGADFAALLETDPVAAGAYLENDILITARVAVKMGAMKAEMLPKPASESWLDKAMGGSGA